MSVIKVDKVCGIEVYSLYFRGVFIVSLIVTATLYKLIYKVEFCDQSATLIVLSYLCRMSCRLFPCFHHWRHVVVWYCHECYVFLNANTLSNFLYIAQ